MPQSTFNTLDTFKTGAGTTGQFYSLPKLETAGVARVSRLPVSIRIVTTRDERHAEESRT